MTTLKQLIKKTRFYLFNWKSREIWLSYGSRETEGGFNELLFNEVAKPRENFKTCVVVTGTSVINLIHRGIVRDD